MSNQETPEGDMPEVIDILFELPPSPRGAYQRKRDDGTIVHGDASGERALDEEGEVDDIVFFVSPLSICRSRKV
jgi:hypothetical protein